MKRFVMGLVFGLVLAMSFSVMANSKIVAQYFSPTIIVDGNKTTLKAKPVTINGSTYLPMRELAETLNYNVQYEASSKTIKLNNRGGNVAVAPPSNNVTKPTPTNPPVNNNVGKDSQNGNYMSLSELESKGFKFTFNQTLLIERGNNSFQLSKGAFDKLNNDGRVSILKNGVVFWMHDDGGNITIENKVLEAFN